MHLIISLLVEQYKEIWFYNVKKSDAASNEDYVMQECDLPKDGRFIYIPRINDDSYGVFLQFKIRCNRNVHSL